MKETEEQTLARQKFSERLEMGGFRKTPERYAVLNAVYSSDKMMAVSEIMQIIKKQRFIISRATIYNVLDLLLRWNLVCKQQIDAHTILYGKYINEIGTIDLRCGVCGNIMSIKSDKWSELVREIEDDFGFKLQSKKLLLQGLCSTCKKH